MNNSNVLLTHMIHWNQQLKFEIWDVSKPAETDSKVVGSNLDPSSLFIYQKWLIGLSSMGHYL